MDKQEVEQREQSRAKLSLLCEKGHIDKEKLLSSYKNDPVSWINDWAVTYDPRRPNKGLPATVPFVLYDYQEDFIEWLDKKRRRGENGVVVKSRTMGISYCCCAYFVHQLLFNEGFSGGLGSYKEDKVDSKQDPDSLFEKIRIILEHLPRWQIPEEYDPYRNDNFCKVAMPSNDTNITGEVSKHMGRGGRSSQYIVDEAAFVENLEEAERALAENSESIIYVSTPYGSANLFAKKAHSEEIETHEIPWHYHPDKDEEWYQQKKKELSEVALAQEIDRDFSASVEGTVIKSKWIDAAVGIELSDQDNTVREAGLDVAAEGSNKNVLIIRDGNRVSEVRSWDQTNTTETAWKAHRICNRANVRKLRYDEIGVGSGVTGTYKSTDKAFEFKFEGVNAADSAGGQEYSDVPGRAADTRFINRRAEDWWNLRLLFKRTYEHVNDITKYDPDKLISIPNHPQLKKDLSSPKLEYNSSGMIKVESKRNMRRRGVDSPDFADSLGLAFSKHKPEEDDKVIEEIEII